MFRTALVPFLALAAVVAQQPWTGRSFLLDDYRNVVFADLAALRRCGVFEDLEASVLNVVFRQMEREAGFLLSALDRVTVVGSMPQGGPKEADPVQIVVFEGNAPLGLPASVTKENWTKEEIAGTVVHRRKRGDGLVVTARPELQVWGPPAHLEPVLAGRPHAGLPDAGVMSLLSGRGDNLAYFVVDVGHPVMREHLLQRLFPAVEWPAEAAPTDLLVRLRAVGEADDPRLEVEAVLRHAKAGEGLATTTEAFAGWLKRVEADPQLRGLRPLWKKVETKVDRTDFTVRLDLGRPRQAVDQLALLAAPILKPRTEAALPPPPVVVEPVPAGGPLQPPKK
jgi:hypothetical protein